MCTTIIVNVELILHPTTTCPRGTREVFRGQLVIVLIIHLPHVRGGVTSESILKWSPNPVYRCFSIRYVPGI
jgi:hypothetical protein